MMTARRTGREDGAMMRKWQSIGISREVYCNSMGQYNLHVWLVSTEGRRLQLDYNGGYWIFRDPKHLYFFDAPAYVEAMFTAKFAEMYAADAFTFFEYRKVDTDLVKDDDPQSLRYHDAEHWRSVVESITRNAATVTPGDGT